MIHRRSLIRLCGLGLLGLSLPALLRAESRPRPAGPTRPRPRARSCILFFMEGGRDHWPHCYTVFFAGGGVQGGAIHGASDRHAAFPEKDPVTPEDIAATIYHAMGVEPETEIVDPLDRPLPVAIGKPIESIFG